VVSACNKLTYLTQDGRFIPSPHPYRLTSKRPLALTCRHKETILAATSRLGTPPRRASFLLDVGRIRVGNTSPESGGKPRYHFSRWETASC
jgi:hypothetical protein